jgi:hypothetical protein
VRRPAIFTLLVAVLAGSTVSAGHAGTVAAPRTVSVPGAFHSLIPSVKRKSGIAVLLPSRIRVYTGTRVYPSGSGSRGTWELGLAAAPRCGGANACVIAYFSARRGGRRDYRTRVRLRGGVTGYFKPLTCGASCSPPVIQFSRAGVLYDFAVKGLAERTERASMIALANSALRAGPR